MKKLFCLFLPIIIFLCLLDHPKDISEAASAGNDSSIYGKMYNAIKHIHTTVYLNKPASSSKMVFNEYRKVIENHPEFFYVKTVYYYSDGRIVFKYKYSKAAIQKMVKAQNQQADQIVRKAKKKKTEFEKVLLIHDAVINLVRYDEKNYEKNTVPDLDYTAYGALVNKKAVCDGYAKAMNLLLNRAGIWSIKVTGKANGESHAWNLVRVNGKYYYLDSTWDDPISYDQTDYLRYKYFLVSGSMLAKDHKWKISNYPKASDTKYSRLQNLQDFVRYGNTIFYINSTNNEIYKTDIWGKKPVKFHAVPAASLKIKNGTIYYINRAVQNFVYQIKPDGTHNKPIVRKTVYTLGLTGHYLKYYSAANSGYEEKRI